MSDNQGLEQAKAQIESIVAMVKALECDFDRLEELKEEKENDETGLWDAVNSEVAEELQELIEAASEYSGKDEAEQAIKEDPLSVEVRSRWYELGDENVGAEEFRILLCTGGPHVELLGDLDNGQPSRVRVTYQGWGESGEYFPTSEERDALETYCQQFYFGE